MLQKSRLFLCVFFFLGGIILLHVTPTQASEENSLLGTVVANISKTAHEGSLDLLIPVNTWHNRWTYDKNKIKEYNERPWGLGLSKSLIINQWRHGLAGMVFLDSHKDIEPIVGYSFQRLWTFGKDKAARISLGGLIGVTMRSDYHYIPIPAPIPLLEIGWKNFSIENTYIPGGHNCGNILFTWLRIKL